MKNWLTAIALLVTLTLGFGSLLIINKELSPAGVCMTTSPCLNNGKKWRIAYYEGGPFYNYRKYLKATLDGLASLGWLKPIKWQALPPDASSGIIWQYLADNAESDYLEFVKRAYWSADWNRKQRNRNRKEILARLDQLEDIDLVLALGSWAGQDLATPIHSTPVVVIYSINPEEAGIILNGVRPAHTHVFAAHDPKNVIRQIKLFHRLTKFKKLGVIVDPRANNEFFSNLSMLKRVARENKFKLLTMSARIMDVSKVEGDEEVMRAHEKLAPQIDAMWISCLQVFDPIKGKRFLKPFFKYKVPTWSPYGEAAVRSGVLFSTCAEPSHYGLIHARAIARIFNGATPGKLIRPTESKYEFILNQAAAKRAGFKMPPGVLLAADKTIITDNQTENHEQQ